MAEVTSSISLVERRKYSEKASHQIAAGIWWVGYFDHELRTSHNPFLIVDHDEAVLINPGSRAEEFYRTVRDKVGEHFDPARIHHIVVLHHDPERCAALPLFAKLAGRNVRVYAPARAMKSIKHYGCKATIIGLDDGDSIIFKSGRTLDYYDTPNLPTAGSGLLFDSQTRTVFYGNIMNCQTETWNLYAPSNGWESLQVIGQNENSSKKAFWHALNKIERLSPERICPQCGPIIEDDIDKYLSAVKNRGKDK